MITYKTYPNTPTFQETPDGNITTFTVTEAFVEGSLVIVHGGMIWKDFTYTDTLTIEFDAAIPTGTEVYILSGFFGTGTSTSDYEDYLTKVQLMIQDQSSILADSDYLLFLTESVKEYSKHRPQITVEDINGTESCELPLPTNWDQDFSKVTAIELIDSQDDDDDIIIPLAPSTYTVYKTPSTTIIRSAEDFVDDYSFRVRYTELHQFTEEICTVPSHDQRNILALAASKACLALAGYFNQQVDMAFSGGATVRRKTEAEVWKDLANQYAAEWRSLMGIPEKTQTPAAATSFAWTYSDPRRVFH